MQNRSSLTELFFQVVKGGQVLAFTSGLPNYGPHALAGRDEVALLGTDNEYKNLVSQDEAWQWLGEEFAENGVGVTIFAFPHQHADLGTIGESSLAPCRENQCFDAVLQAYSPNYWEVTCSIIQSILPNATSIASCISFRWLGLERLCTPAGFALGFQQVPAFFLCFQLLLNFGYLSLGLRTREYRGSLYETASGDILSGTLDTAKAFAVSIEHMQRLDTRKDVYVQCAILYTSSEGQRRVRLINLALGVASLANNVFRFSDIDATTSWFAKNRELAFRSSLKTSRSVLVYEILL